MSEKPVASIKTLARYKPDTVYIGTGEYVAGCVRADDGDYYLAADVDAAIEALRAEVAAWRELSDHVRVGACAAIWPDRYTDARTRDVAAALKRAARMEEALALLPDEIVMVEHNPYEGPLMFCCGQRVTSGGLHDLLTNHSKGCWYARMRAMRDQDQEDCNG